MKRGFSAPNDHMAEGDEAGGGEREREGLSSFSIKLEIFLIYHHAPAQNATQLSLYPCEKHHAEWGEEKEKRKRKLSEPLQQPMGKINMQMYARN